MVSENGYVKDVNKPRRRRTRRRRKESSPQTGMSKNGVPERNESEGI